MAKQKMIKNSDKYIEDNREKIIEELNNGTRKFLQMQTLAKYNININPKTLKYYHDTKHEEITTPLKLEPTLEPIIEQQATQEQLEPMPYIEATGEQTQQDEDEELTEAIEQEPEAIPTTETHRMIATMIKEYSKNYIVVMEDKPMTEEEEIHLQDAKNYLSFWSRDKTTNEEEPPTQPPTPTHTNESGEWEETMTAEELKQILEQDEITDEDKNKLTIYLRKKKNKRKRNLLREIRDKFEF